MSVANATPLPLRRPVQLHLPVGPSVQSWTASVLTCAQFRDVRQGGLTTARLLFQRLGIQTCTSFAEGDRDVLRRKRRPDRRVSSSLSSEARHGGEAIRGRCRVLVRAVPLEHRQFSNVGRIVLPRVQIAASTKASDGDGAGVRSHRCRPLGGVFGGVMGALLLALVACSSGGETAQDPPATVPPEPTISPSASSTVDPLALPALRAYEAGIEATRNAARHPFDEGDQIAAKADFTRYMFDPFLTTYKFYIWNMAETSGEYRGTPPRLNVVIKSLNLSAKPWPTVILSDCQTGGKDWRLYDSRTGKVQPRVKQKVSSPYQSTVTMIFFEKHWGIQKLTLDKSRTCSP